MIPSDVDYEDVPSLIGSESSFNNDDDAEFPVLQPHFDIVTDNSSVFHRMHIGHNIGFFHHIIHTTGHTHEIAEDHDDQP